MYNYLRLLACSLFFVNLVNSQAAKNYSPADIYQDIEKLNFLGSALYIAAHPDDENTRLISYLSNYVHARTGYLSLTRGDGGQNLIGSELRELLGVLRTQELLAARRVDGGEQFFTRANDFGYSKHPDETLEIWNEELILGDVVKTIRQFQPDIIINRFNHRTPGSTHGHHTSSAMLSVEAFDLAGKPNAYPEQLQNTKIWQPRRLFFNTSWWFYGSQEKFEKADKSQMLNMDIGVYYPMEGMSNNEIASLASSEHLSQGFGRLTKRGTEQEYIELLKGDLPKDKSNLFAGINTSWSRIDGGKEIGEILNKVQTTFNFKNPKVHLPQLLNAYQLLQKTSNEHWKIIKTKELTNIILAITGIYLEANTKTSYATPGSSLEFEITALNRSDLEVTLNEITVSGKRINNETTTLEDNTPYSVTSNLAISPSQEYTSPYWLTEKGTLGTYTVNEPKLIGKPETPRAYTANFVLNINGTSFTVSRPLTYKYAKPDKGELSQPFEVVPVATAKINDKVLIFADGVPKEIPVTIHANEDNIKGEVQLCYGKQWVVNKEVKSFNISKKGDEQTVYFKLSPPELENEDYISPIIKINGKEISKEMVTIAYDHIPTQTVLLPSETKVVRLNIQKAGENIGYVMGAGDEIPTSLTQIGYNVQIINPEDITSESLKKYDAVVMGIRAYNVLEELKFKQKFILDYVKNGGTMVVQYNTAGRWGSQFENIAPYNLELSRDRVTDENSEVQIIAPNHSLVNFPNKITKADFDGWVQERGLYFPNKWAPEFSPILEMKDKGENPTQGSLLVAPYGKGYYIYSGLSFFRELPVGVPGAYKLFSNMLSIGKDKMQSKELIKG